VYRSTLIVFFIFSLLMFSAWAAEPSVADADPTAAVAGNNLFAVELYGQLKSQPGNLFFSPESISTALAMTYAGARGETATEIAKTMHFTLPPEKLHPAMGALLSDLNAAHDGYQLRVANALWEQEGYTFLDDFLKLTKDNYGAGFNQVDFKGATEAARLTINQWVEQETENKIKDLLEPGVLKPETRLVLTNAIYFKGDWQTQFDKKLTRAEDFHVSKGQIVKAPLMHRTGEYNYYDGGTFQVLAIPYKNSELALVILLPRHVDGLPSLEQSMTPDRMQGWIGQLRSTSEVVVTMPKFKIESQFDVGGKLSAMGMARAFDPHRANFSGMVPKGEMQRDGSLYISAVIHKAIVEINEEGTVAAAATAVSMDSYRVVRLESAPPHVFRADHPFLFLIRDNRSGSILFAGRVANPST